MSSSGQEYLKSKIKTADHELTCHMAKDTYADEDYDEESRLRKILYSLFKEYDGLYKDNWRPWR